jgi:S-(hydroxymethyl)glutathione dehydrogenase/alcohol dehydrogenase
MLKMLRLYQEGNIKLDELITSRYKLDDINQGYLDLHDGKNIRGVIVYD